MNWNALRKQRLRRMRGHPIPSAGSWIVYGLVWNIYVYLYMGRSLAFWSSLPDVGTGDTGGNKGEYMRELWVPRRNEVFKISRMFYWQKCKKYIIHGSPPGLRRKALTFVFQKCLMVSIFIVQWTVWSLWQVYWTDTVLCKRHVLDVRSLIRWEEGEERRGKEEQKGGESF